MLDTGWGGAPTYGPFWNGIYFGEFFKKNMKLHG
jgi:hypothetical protein